MKLRSLALLALLGLVNACSSSHQATPASQEPSSTTRTQLSVSCKTAPLHRGAAPKWTAPAWSSSSPGFASRLRYAESAGGNVVGVLFAYPLRAGRPENPANKILWIVRQARNGQPLHIHAQPIGFSASSVSSNWPANASPGEIYPSIDNVPVPGCWRFSLRWAGHTDVVALHYGSASGR
jgi:hypothetical protein